MAKTTTYDSAGTLVTSVDTTQSTTPTTSTGTGTTTPTTGSTDMKYELGPYTTNSSLTNGQVIDLNVVNNGSYQNGNFKAPYAVNITGYTAYGFFADQKDLGTPVAFGLLVQRIPSGPQGNVTLVQVDPETQPRYVEKVGVRYVFPTSIAVAQDDNIRFALKGPSAYNCAAGLVFFIQVTTV